MFFPEVHVCENLPVGAQDQHHLLQTCPNISRIFFPLLLLIQMACLRYHLRSFWPHLSLRLSAIYWPSHHCSDRWGEGSRESLRITSCEHGLPCLTLHWASLISLCLIRQTYSQLQNIFGENTVLSPYSTFPCLCAPRISLLTKYFS